MHNKQTNIFEIITYIAYRLCFNTKQTEKIKKKRGKSYKKNNDKTITQKN